MISAACANNRIGEVVLFSVTAYRVKLKAVLCQKHNTINVTCDQFGVFCEGQ